jgi:WbqC-like protein family
VNVKTVAIVQSCYIPWKGYFDLINSADEFILYDDRQFTRRDWRNRNRIKTAQGPRWLTIPVDVKGKYEQTIAETVVHDPGWARRHWQTLEQAYRRAPFFDRYREPIADWYASAPGPRLSDVNRHFLEAICGRLGIRTTLSWSSDYNASGSRTERLVSLCRATGAARYVSGPRARDYLDEALFAEAGIELVYADYASYPEYPQLHPPFEHAVTILDLLFQVGDAAPDFMKTFAPTGATHGP